MRVDRLAVMLSNSPQRRTAGGMREETEQKGAEDDEGEGIMFSHQRGAGGWAEGMCLCTSIYVNGFVSRPEVPEAMPQVKMATKYCKEKTFRETSGLLLPGLIGY